ncbi:MAG TPA: M23 family metallopeptidase [Candidatus Paceibacterota bacterium]|nr:M23 family metallopeptidase [Candidatus Paceibacterota bacterium]
MVTTVVSASGLFFPIFALFPVHVDAFWPFSLPASAATKMPMLHDPSIGLLAAAANENPDPIKADEVGAQISDSALMAGSGPKGTLADVASSTPSSEQISVYVVRKGDTLSVIAQMFNVSVNTVVWANDLGSTRAIHEGQTLVILPVSGVERTVIKGDTLKSIAKKYGADADEIAEYNGLESDAVLAVGTTLIIPGGEVATPVPVVKAKGVTRAGGKIYEPYLGGSGAEIAGYFANPIPGARMTQGLHGWNGIDLGAAKGTAIHAAAGGTVIVAKANGGWNGGYGNYVVISHPNGTQTLYAHMTSVGVSVGQAVSRSSYIGTVGSTGLSTGPHLHFEVRGAKNPFASCAVRTVCEPR